MNTSSRPIGHQHTYMGTLKEEEREKGEEIMAKAFQI